MKFYRKKKKGFTIVELVIVIAVIAVLAAVLIPTFISLTNKANKASDQALVKNLNTALATQEQVSGDTKNNTMHDAVEDLKEYGYLLPNLVTKSDEKLLWDRTTNRFLLEEEASAGKTLDYWRIQDNLNEQKYNVYAGTKFAIDDAKLTALKVGFDAGYTEGIESIKYLGNGVSAQEVVIRTNGGALEVNAPTDIVNHYSDLDNLDVQAVAGESYHEHGKVKVTATINSGHFVVEKTGYINELAIPESATSASVVIKPKGEVNTAVIDSTTASVVIDNGADVNQIVGETTNISGSGSSEAKANAVTKTAVANQTELKAALDEGKKYISLTQSFSITESVQAKDKQNNQKGLLISSSTIIDGNGYTTTFESPSNSRGYVLNEDSIEVTFKNLKSNSSDRGIQVTGAHCKATIYNCEITNIAHYGINIATPAVGADINVIGSTVSAYGALNLWCSNYKVYVSGCTLVGTNTTSRNSLDNDFGTICLEGTYAFEDPSSTGIEIVIDNSTIRAIANDSNDQFGIVFNDGSTANHVHLNNVTFDLQGYAYKWCHKYGIEYTTMDNALTNRVYENGIDTTETGMHAYMTYTPAVYKLYDANNNIVHQIGQ